LQKERKNNKNPTKRALNMTEKAVTNKILRHLNQISGVKAVKRLSNGNTNGFADITGTVLICGLGVRLEIEVKQPGETPRKLQVYRLKQAAEAGACAGWADNVQDAVDLVLNFREYHEKRLSA